MTEDAPAAGRPRRPRGSRRAVGGDRAPEARREPAGAPAQSRMSSGQAPEPVPETLDEVADGARRDDWLSSQRPPHWG